MAEQANNTVHRSVNGKPGFQSMHRGHNSVFHPKHLSLGLVVPLECYSQGPVPTMSRHLERVQLAEQLRFAAVALLFSYRHDGAPAFEQMATSHESVFR